MAKGTKQVRIGKLIEMVRNMEARVEKLQDASGQLHQYKGKIAREAICVLEGQIMELELCISIIKNGYDIDTKEEN